MRIQSAWSRWAAAPALVCTPDRRGADDVPTEEYGGVVAIVKGRFKGRPGYYDDDTDGRGVGMASSTSIARRRSRKASQGDIQAMTPEEVVDAFGERATRLRVKVLEAESGLVLVEGRKDDLEFLGRLLLAVAEGGDPGFHLDPRGAGAAHFDPGSPLGLYIHRAD